MRPISVALPYGDSVFFPACCLHWPIGERDLLKEWVEKVRRTPNGFALLLGDSHDGVRTHYRDHIRSYRSDQNSQILLDDFIRKDVRDLAKVLEPIKGKILGAIRGNHYWEFADGTNTEQYLCQLLGLRYLGVVGLIRVDFKHKEKVRNSMVIYAHHHGGTKGARTTGGDMGALERAEGQFDADVYVLGHTHRRYGVKLPKLSLTSKGNPPRIREHSKALIRAGSFLKGFKEDFPTVAQPHFPTYAEEGALRPLDLGWVELHISFRAGDYDINRDFKVSF